MICDIFIQPHERYEALEAYKDRLSPEQIEEFENAPEGAIIRLSVGINQPGTTLTVIEEG